MGKNFVKVITTIFFSLLIVVMAGGKARADIIWQPEDDFFEKNVDLCKYVDRTYTAKAKKGKVTVWESPVSNKKLAAFKNGTKLYISYTYQDTWGYAEINQKSSKTSGWVKMNEVEVVYDYISFEQEHKEEFKDYQGELDGYAVKNEVLFWTYPGSGVVQSSSKNISDIRIQHTYTDAKNRKWGFVFYYCGSRRSWICLSDPENATIPAFGKNAAADGNSMNAVPLKATFWGDNLWMLLVGSLVIGTSFLIRVFWRKNEIDKKQP